MKIEATFLSYSYGVALFLHAGAHHTKTYQIAMSAEEAKEFAPIPPATARPVVITVEPRPYPADSLLAGQ